LKKIIKGINKETASPVIIKQEAATPSIQREKKTPKPLSTTKPFTSKKPVVSKKEGLKKKSGVGKAIASGTTKGLLKSLGLEDDGGYSPKGKAKKYKKAKPTTFEKLQEGWENWDAPPRQKLGYDTQ